MDFVLQRFVELVIVIAIFLILVFICSYIVNRFKNSPNRLLNPEEYFPEEEIHSLKQIFYLIMMGLFFVNVIYSISFTAEDIVYFALYDIVISLYVAVWLDKSILKNKILLFLLIPFGSLTYILFGNSLVGLLDLIHIPVFIYLIKIFYDKFREYTESNGLGITIILLFIIVFISFFITQLAESTKPLDSLVMVSNAFTSNGYSILGTSIIGKLNAIFLVWGGYVLSGVGTATLAAGIIITRFNSKFDELNSKIDELEELLKKNNDE